MLRLLCIESYTRDNCSGSIMASCPTTIVLLTEDKVRFPIKWMLVAKQLFQYGVKEIVEKDDKLFISLTYSPRASTLKKKFGNLPVRYMRTRIEDDDEFRILEKAVKRYKFNLLDEVEEDHMKLVWGSGVKRKEIVYVSDDGDNNDGPNCSTN